MKSSGIAYLLWFLGGPFSLHRFYLRKYWTGALYLCTGGLFTIGWLIDLFRIPYMVEHENLKWQLKHGHTVNINIQGQTGAQASLEPPVQPLSRDRRQDYLPTQPPVPPEDPEKALERTILRLARKFRGQLTPLELAADSDLSLDDANNALEDIVRKGYANMKVTDEGNIIYEFPGFLQFGSTDSREL